jgi:predicted RNase H-like HicB family nuclease
LTITHKLGTFVLQIYVCILGYNPNVRRSFWQLRRRFCACGLGIRQLKFTIETEQEEDGRWLAEVLELPGVLAYGETRDEAIAHVQALGLRVLADRIEHGEAAPELVNTVFAPA